MKTDATSPPNADVVNPHSSLPYIHRFYLLLKGHYFLHFSAFGIIYPILNITLRARGLSNVELSYFNIGIPFLVFVTNPLLNYVADLTRRYKLMFNCVFAIATIACVVIFILPPIKSHHIQADLIDDHELGHVLEFCASQEVGTKCASRTECGCSYRANCTIVDTVYQRNPNEMKTFSFTFSMGLKNTSKEFKDDSRSCGLQYRVPVYQRFDASNFVPHQSTRLAICEITCSIAHYCHGSRYSDQTRFVILYSLLFVLAADLLTNAIPLGVAIGFSTLHRADIFGKQRVWGTIGFGISAFLASRLYEVFQSEYVYVIFFMIMAAICMVITSFVRIQPEKRKRHPTVEEVLAEDDGQVKKKKNKSQSLLFELIPLVKRIDVIVFLLLLFVWGMSYGVLDPYLYLYIDEIAPCQSRSIVGYMSLISAIAEVIALFFAEKVLKLLGTDVASIIILLAFALRFAGYYFILQPFLLPIAETMHFFNFGILYVLVLQKAASIAPARLVGTLQSLSLGINFGLARGIGLVVSSFIYTLLEQRVLFLVFAIFNVICAIIFALYFLITRKRSNGQTDLAKPPVDPDVNANEEPLLTRTTA